METTLRPTLQPFLDISINQEEARYVILGAPLDETGSYRRGTRFAPEAIRHASQYMETYSPRTGLDLDDISFADIGNLRTTGPVEEYLREIQLTVKDIAGSGKFPVILGGEHTVTLGALRGLKPELVVSFDAHFDLRDELMGLRLSHATFLRRAFENLDFRLAVLGPRAVSKEEVVFAKRNAERIIYVPSSEMRKGIADSLEPLKAWLDEASSVYISIDMDVLDPSVAPAVGNPSPEGIDVTCLLDAVERFVDSRVVGFDLTEVSPYYDSGLTATQASYIVLETIYLLERATGGSSG